MANRKRKLFLWISFLCIWGNLIAQVKIEIDASKQEKPVSRLLYGKFTEHLGTNVYQGAWAQLIYNPEFVPLSRWPTRGNGTNVENYLEEAARIFNLPNLTSDPKRNIAAFWTGSTTLQGQLLKEGVNDFQRLIMNRDSGKIMTGIFPPLHRINILEISLKARSEPAGKKVKIQLLNFSKDKVGEVCLTLNKEWTVQQVKMAIDDDKHERGAPYILHMIFENNSQVDLDRLLIFPSDHMDGWEPEVVKYVRDAKIPLLRFPGGNFVSGYHWEDGVGPLDNRPVLPNPAWPIVEWNHVGTDEWIRFCRMTGAEPMICINAGNGSPNEAAEWVRYCNEAADKEFGKMRATNANIEPYNIRWWEIGNELPGQWQIGHTDADGYAERYSQFESAMHAIDPNLLLIANGQLRVWQANRIIDQGGQRDWNEKLVEKNREKVRSISVHSLPGGHLTKPDDPIGVWKDLLAYADHYPDFLNELVVEPMKKKGLKPLVAITELQAFTKHPALPKENNWGGALWYSAMLNQCIRSGDLVELITHSALLNHGGGLKKNRGIVFADPVWWITHLYSTQRGIIPIAIKIESPTFSSSGRYIVKRDHIPYIDGIALIDSARETCTVMLANRHETLPMKIELSLKNFKAIKEIEVSQIHADKLSLKNTWEHPKEIYPTDSRIYVNDGEIKYELPPLSFTRLIFLKDIEQKTQNNK